MLDQFITTWTGKSPSYDGVPENIGHCYQLFNFYNRDVVGAPDFLMPLAYQIYTSFPGSPLEPFYDRIELSSGFVAQYGDVVIWSPELPGTQVRVDGKLVKAGHVDICIDHNASPLQFIGFDSNWQGKTAHQVTHNYDYVLGVLRPKGVRMDHEDVNRIFRLWQRDATQAELDYWMGKKPELLAASIYNDPANDEFRRKAITYDAKVAELSNALAMYQAQAVDVEANLLGRALIKLIQAFGYKK